MQSDEEFYDATVGLPQLDGDGDDAEQTWLRSECDAVVCLVDCSEDMFRPTSAAHAHLQPGEHDATAGARLPDCPEGLRVGHRHAVQGQRSGVVPCDAPENSSYFSMAIHSIHALLMEKLTSASKDVMAIVLYNTERSLNAAGHQGVFVAQPAARVGTACLQRVDELLASGVRGSVAYDQFKQHVGHASRSRPHDGGGIDSFSTTLSDSNNSAASGSATAGTSSSPSSASVLCSALCVAQEALMGVCEADIWNHRRVFVFTNESDPTKGSRAEWERCRDRARDLVHAVVTLEVFGFGDDTRRMVRGLDAPLQHAVASRSLRSTTAAEDEQSASKHSAPVLSSTSFSTAPIHTDAAVFDPELFWSPLMQLMQPPLTEPAISATERGDGAVVGFANDDARVSNGIGVVNVYAGPAAFHHLLSMVARRAHPQQPFRHCELRIGGPNAKAAAGEALSSSGAAVPRMAVSLYHPLMRARQPPGLLLEKETHRMMRRVTRLYASGGNADGDTQNREVTMDNLCYYVNCGGDRVYFTKEERKAVVEVAAAGAEPGFTILFFKDLGAAVSRASVVQRCSFLHAHAAEGGPHSHRLFVLLVRRLREKGKAGIAQYRSTSAAAPQLVALIPSPNLETNPEKRLQVPVEGLGLYVVPLPYAEDLRSVPDPYRGNLVNEKGSTADPAHVELAKHVIDALTLTYAIDEVANPALQRRYDVLRSLSRRSHFCADGSMGLSAEPGKDSRTANEEEETRPLGKRAGVHLQHEDETLPDYAGMRLHAQVFRNFNNEVLGAAYDPAAVCPQLASHGRRPRSSNDSDVVNKLAAGASIVQIVHTAAEANTLESLTVAQLKTYLSSFHISPGAVRCKADFIALVQGHVRSAQAQAHAGQSAKP